MATETEVVSVKFGANIDELQSKLGEVVGIFKTVTERFAALAAVVAGGAAFKEFIDTTTKLNSEAMKLSKTLGLTGEEAGNLNTALGDIGSDAETYTGAFLKFNRELRSNSDTMKALGVDVDGLRSGQKSSNEEFVNALAIFGQYKPGIDQTQVAMQLFGRSVEDVQKLQKLANEVTEDTAERLGKSKDELDALLTPMQKYEENLKTAEEKNRSLNLVITEESVAATKKYNKAINDVGDVMNGFKKTIGDAVIPLLAESAKSFASLGPKIIEGVSYAAQIFVEMWHDIGEAVQVVWDLIKDVLSSLVDGMSGAFGRESPSAMEIFKNALRAVRVVVIEFRTAIEIVVNLVRTALLSLGATFVMLGDVASAAFRLDWNGVKAAWTDGIENVKAITKQGIKEIAELAAQGGEDISKALTDPLERQTGTTKGAPKAGDKTAPDLSAQSTLQGQLNIQRAQQEAAEKLQTEYLKQAAEIYKRAYDNDLISTKEYYDAKNAVEVQAIETSLESKRSQLEATKKLEDKAIKGEDKLKFQAEEIKLLGEIDTLEARRNGTINQNAAEYADAERKRIDALVKIHSEAQRDSALKDIEMEQSKIDQMRSMRQIDAEQQYAALKDLENKRYAAIKKELDSEQLLVRGNIEKQAQLDAKSESAEKEHQQRLLQIHQKSEIDRAKYSLETQQTIQDAFAKTLNDFMSGTKKMSDILRGFVMSVVNAFQSLIAKKFAEKIFEGGGNKLVDSIVNPISNAINMVTQKWIAGQSAQTAATAAGATERTAIEEGAAKESIATTAMTAIKNIGAKAWEAASSVYASIAAIPYVGPFLAPAMAVAAGAAVLSYAGRIASAEGGWWHVPGDQIAQIHKDEMVMPAPLAQGVRDMVTGKSKGAGSGLTVHINAVDGNSVKRLFMEHGDALAAAMRKQARNFAKS